MLLVPDRRRRRQKERSPHDRDEKGQAEEGERVPVQ